MRIRSVLICLLLAACTSPQNESQLRRTPWERADFVFPGGPEGVSIAIHQAAKHCFDGKRINRERTFVHREPAPDGGEGFIVTTFQLGTYDANILAQIDIKPAPAGAKVLLFRSASLPLSKPLAGFIEGWVRDEMACPPLR